MALDATASTGYGGGGEAEAVRPFLLSGEEAEELDATYAPYARRDAYGTMGRGRLSAPQQALLALRCILLVPLRFVAGMLVLLAYYVVCRVCTLSVDGLAEGRPRLEGWRRVIVARSGRALARAMLFVFGFYWIRKTDRSSPNAEDIHQGHSKEMERPGAIVSNHVSYVDILYHMSVSFPSFVAKESVSRLPLVGLISKCLGCIFVQRESKASDSKGVSGAVTERVQEDIHQGHSKEMERPGAIVSNHVSYVDILYHMSVSFPSFVAKESVSRLPLVGLISKCLGCIFVQRESKASDSKGVSGAVTERVQEVCQYKNSPMMLLFPG
ncbi:hypothetical protein GUJ93_ZPchr0001g32034 [Zizania palustris]|uniref:Phospholipid/glycerol acyltransferase domain-containing protein n=1 Tax=Zizania palustris TaxID=103762 RepID=A0A8J5S8I9_ZIZPA|nr:hypothetical protein GUJ93_ZPchr0001g32034 [Zizania palustris]